MQTIASRFRLFFNASFVGWLLVILGMALRLRVYIANRSFWHDEAALALNLVNRTFGGLTQPLDYNQGAPIGFLFIEKLLITGLGNQDFILRLFPLISGIFATYLIFLITREYFKAGGLFAVFMFSISWPLIYYSSELKQYSSDVMIVLLMIYLGLHCLEENARIKDFLLMSAAGFISIWISHPSIFVLAGIGLVLFFEKLLRKRNTHILYVVGMGLLWLISFGATYLVSLRYLVSNQNLENYWIHGFMPMPPWKNWDWFADTYLSLLSTTSAAMSLRYMVVICSFLIVIGVVSLFLRKTNIAWSLSFPFFIVSIASILQKYPLRGRFLLFLVPIIILLMVEGFGRIYTILAQKWNRNLAFGVCAFLVLIIFWSPAKSAFSTFLAPPMRDHIKPALEYIENHKTPDDVIYVYHGARPSFNYYAPFYGLVEGNIISGDDLSDKPALKQFYKQTDRLIGNDRVWILFSHVIDCGDCAGDMEDFYVQYLNQFGKIEDQFKSSGATLYLYNFNQ
jgi:hypothetical protein